MALLLLLGSAERCHAAEGTSGTVHNISGYGLRLDVDTRWFEGFGYRPVRVTVTPTAKVVADRTLRLEFLTRRPGWREPYDLRVQQDIEIPAGTGPVTAIDVTLSVPDYGWWDSYCINVFEDGQQLDRLCIPRSGTPTVERIESWPRILVAGDDHPDTSELVALVPAEQWQYQTRYYPPGKRGSPSVQLPTVVGVLEPPARWIDYTSLDVVCLSLERLRQLKKLHLAELKAMLAWTAAGGNLWVYDVGDDWERLGQLEDLLRLPPDASDLRDAKTRGWNEPAKELFGKPSPFGEDNSDAAASPEAEPAGGTGVSPVPPGRPVKSPQKPPFLLRPLGMGMVAAIAAKTPFREKNAGWKQAEWNWLLHAVGKDRWVWSLRHGMSMVRNNEEFWNFLIPGVGLPPVTAFCVLITLFVLAIGPLNYWLLRRVKRLHLLVVTTPLGAASLTLVLFGYALVSDGLATRVRVRSVTEIDQGRGQAVCWARLSYYAGVAPWRGLRFPADVAVFPLEETPMDSSKNWASRELIWEEDQRLAAGWLGSRTPMQLLTVRSRPTTAGLDVVEPAGESGKLKVRNRLGTPIERLAVRTADNRCFWGTSIAADATAVLEPIEPDAARERLRQDSQKHQPTLPPGMSRQMSTGIFGLSRARYYNYGSWASGGNLGSPAQATGRLEQSLGSFGGVFPDDPLPPVAGYVAVVADSPEVVVGTPSARQEASYHVILGRW